MSSEGVNFVHWPGVSLTHCDAKRVPFTVSVFSLFLVLVFVKFTLQSTLSQSAFE